MEVLVEISGRKVYTRLDNIEITEYRDFFERSLKTQGKEVNRKNIKQLARHMFGEVLRNAHHQAEKAKDHSF